MGSWCSWVKLEDEQAPCSFAANYLGFWLLQHKLCVFLKVENMDGLAAVVSRKPLQLREKKSTVVLSTLHKIIPKQFR